MSEEATVRRSAASKCRYAARRWRISDTHPTAVAWLALSAAVLIAGAMMIAVAAPAFAHTPSATLTCSSWSIGATQYESAQHNTYSVSIDGAPAITGSFGSSFSKSGTFPVGSGNHTLVGYVYQNDDPSATYSKTYDLHTDGCLTYVPVPSAPSASPPTCDHAGTLTVAPPGPHVSVSGGTTGDGPGTYTITYTTDTGYTFPNGDATKAYQITVLPKLSGDSCKAQVSPVAPTLTQSACTGPGTHSQGVLHIPAVTGVVYTIGGTVVSGDVVESPGTVVTVVASPAGGFRFDGDQSVTYQVTFTAPGNCLVGLTVAAPSFEDDVCSGGQPAGSAGYTIPDAEHVRFTVGGVVVPAGRHPVEDGSTITVAASPLAGYQLTGTTRWTHTFGSTPTCRGTAGVHAHGTPGGGGTLAVTGSPVGGLVLGGVLLLVVGGVLAGAGMLRRESQAL